MRPNYIMRDIVKCVQVLLDYCKRAEKVVHDNLMASEYHVINAELRVTKAQQEVIDIKKELDNERQQTVKILQEIENMRISVKNIIDVPTTVSLVPTPPRET